MNKQLYKLTDDYKTLEGMLDKEDYDPADIKNMLDNVKEQIGDKVENIAKFVLNLKADATIIFAEEKRLYARKQAVEHNIEWLKSYLLNEMTAVGIDKVKREVLTVSIRTNPPSVEVVNEEEIPEEYQHWTWTPEKKLMIEHFKATGEIVPGVSIITEKKSIVIR